ncbi:MAG: flagellar export protein FliJ [Vampirovibrionales bacterium]|nr:flagellar export protein FliJ [Vampirovibrionales bacterium]
MPRFAYRLQKVFELRERKKQEQERRVQQATEAVKLAKQRVQANRDEHKQVLNHMYRSPSTMYEYHDRYLNKLDVLLVQLKASLEEAEQRLQEEREKLLKAQAELDALVKHKDKAYEEWQAEEKQLDMRRLDEVAGQRYFRQQAQNAQDDLAEALQRSEDAASKAERD